MIIGAGHGIGQRRTAPSAVWNIRAIFAEFELFKWSSPPGSQAQKLRVSLPDSAQTILIDPSKFDVADLVARHHNSVRPHRNLVEHSPTTYQKPTTREPFFPFLYCILYLAIMFHVCQWARKCIDTAIILLIEHLQLSHGHRLLLGSQCNHRFILAT